MGNKFPLSTISIQPESISNISDVSHINVRVHPVNLALLFRSYCLHKSLLFILSVKLKTDWRTLPIYTSKFYMLYGKTSAIGCALVSYIMSWHVELSDGHFYRTGDWTWKPWKGGAGEICCINWQRPPIQSKKTCYWIIALNFKMNYIMLFLNELVSSEMP